MTREVQVHNDDTGGTATADSSSLAMIVLLIAILAIALFSVFAWNGNLFRTGGAVQGERDTDVNIEGGLDLPDSGPGATQTPQ